VCRFARTESLMPLFCTEYGGWGMSIGMRRVLTVLMVALSAAGCEVSKSSSPLSPSIAGPIAGVEIARPNALEPGQDWQIFMRDQPIKLLFQNATTNGVRPITYTVEIASDAAFASVVFKRAGITPASGATTSLQLPDALATGRTYWWHVRAEDGANSSDYSVAKSFVAVTPVNLGAPVAKTPSGTITITNPEFKITAGSQSGPVGHIVYTVQVANDAAFTSIAALFIPDETRPETTVAQNYKFLNDKTYYWRVQAKDTGDSQAVSPWSATQTFTTQPLPPPPPAGGGVGAGWQSCGSIAGYDLVACVRAAVNPTGNGDLAFEVTKRVAWLLRGQGAGLLIKNGGENTIPWRGYSFSISRICYPNGGIVKVVSDAGPGGGNGAAWDTSLNYAGSVSPTLYVPAINPDLP
jgi:hypothetical protein